jgi:hypothetical protein
VQTNPGGTATRPPAKLDREGLPAGGTQRHHGHRAGPRRRGQAHRPRLQRAQRRDQRHDEFRRAAPPRSSSSQGARCGARSWPSSSASRRPT